jgi:hypothetical protein
MSAKRPYHDELSTLTAASAAAGLARTTLISAIAAGSVKAYPTADGTPLVRLADVKAYANNRPNPGPKVKQ